MPRGLAPYAQNLVTGGRDEPSQKFQNPDKKVQVMNIPEVTKARAEVIEGFIQIETLISSIISNYYVGRQNPFSFVFALEVLYDENCSFGMKRNILEKILDSIMEGADKKAAEAQFQKLFKLNKIRNLFGHCGPDIYLAKEGNDIRITPNPSNPSQRVDFDKEYQEFRKLEPEVFLWLNELLPQIDELRQKGLQKFYSVLTSHTPESQ